MLHGHAVRKTTRRRFGMAQARGAYGTTARWLSNSSNDLSKTKTKTKTKTKAPVCWHPHRSEQWPTSSCVRMTTANADIVAAGTSLEWIPQSGRYGVLQNGFYAPCATVQSTPGYEFKNTHDNGWFESSHRRLKKWRRVAMTVF